MHTSTSILIYIHSYIQFIYIDTHYLILSVYKHHDVLFDSPSLSYNSWCILYISEYNESFNDTLISTSYRYDSVYSISVSLLPWSIGGRLASILFWAFVFSSPLVLFIISSRILIRNTVYSSVFWTVPLSLMIRR